MRVEDQPTIKGRACRSVGVTWFPGLGFIFNLWHKRISWSPSWVVLGADDE